MSVVNNIYRPLLALALPLIFIQICQASLGLIDTMVAGQFNYKDLAGVGLGSAMWTPVFILFTGIMFVLVPKISGLAVTADIDGFHALFVTAKRLAWWLSIAGFFVVQILAFLAPYIISDQEVAIIAARYLHFVGFAMPGLIQVLVYRFCCEGSSQLGPIIKVFIVLMFCNTLLNLIFVFGIGPLDGLGGPGCGLATAVSAYISLFVIKSLAVKAVPQLQQPVNSIQAESGRVKRLFAEGIPIGLAFLVEVLALTTLAFFASSLGVKQVAAHQIAINIAMVVFMIPLALSSATTIRIAHFSSLENFKLRKQTAKAAVLMALLYGLLVAVIISLGQPFLQLFSDDSTTLTLAAGLLMYVALFQLFDAIQIVAAGVLRGLQQFVSPMLVLLIIYWVLVVPMSYFAIDSGWWGLAVGVDTIWLFLSGGIAFSAIVLCILTFKQLCPSFALSREAI